MIDRPILLGSGAGLLAALMLAWPAADAWFDMADARAEVQQLESEARRPPAAPTPLMPIAAQVAAPDLQAARRSLAAAIGAEARTGGLLVEQVTPAVAPGEGLAAVTLSISGPEAGMIRFADAIEGDRPAMRMVIFEMKALPDGSVRLTGMLVAPWHR